jgi:hypothetical protein
MGQPSRQLAAGSDGWPKAETEGWGMVGHRPFAGGGESRRPQGVSNRARGGISSGFAFGYAGTSPGGDKPAPTIIVAASARTGYIPPLLIK